MQIVTAILTFISTNMDDFLVLMLLFSQAAGKRDAIKILLGQYLGIGILIFVSLMAAAAATLVPRGIVRLLGLIPLVLGIGAIFRKEEDDTGSIAKISILSVAGLTLAGGGDNLGIYIPMLAGLKPSGLMLTLLVYILMVPLWNFLAARVAGLPAVAKIIEKYERILVPVVFIGLGLMILLDLG